MRTTALWKTLVGARFTDGRSRAVKVAVSGGVAKVYFKDGDVEAVHLVGFELPEGEYVGHQVQQALGSLRAYAEGIAAAVGKRADELEELGHEDAAAVMRALLDLDLFALLAEVRGAKVRSDVVGALAIRRGNASLCLPIEVRIDSMYVAHVGPHTHKFERYVRAYADSWRLLRDAWLVAATKYWRLALEWSREAVGL